jgi:hypothetical protein
LRRWLVQVDGHQGARGHHEHGQARRQGQNGYC